MLSPGQYTVVNIRIKMTKLFRLITLVTPEKGEGAQGVDLRTLRAIRVLRPLKLVSGVPSELTLISNRPAIMPSSPIRLASGLEVHPESPGPADADRLARHVCHRHFRHHWARVLLWRSAQVLLFY